MNEITFQNVYQIDTAAAFKVGQRSSTPDGREWVYVEADTAVADGLIAVPNAVTAVDTVSSATDQQGRIVFITQISAGWTVGQFADGIGVIDAGTGAGQTFKIKSNTVDTLELYPETALSTALSVSDSDLTIRTMGLVDPAAITSAVQSAVGAPQTDLAAGDFGWALTAGDGKALAGEILVVGAGFSTGDNTVGQVIKAVTAEGPFDAQNLGFALVANVADDGALVRFQIR